MKSLFEEVVAIKVEEVIAAKVVEEPSTSNITTFVDEVSGEIVVKQARDAELVVTKLEEVVATFVEKVIAAKVEEVGAAKVEEIIATKMEEVIATREDKIIATKNGVAITKFAADFPEYANIEKLEAAVIELGNASNMLSFLLSVPEANNEKIGKVLDVTPFTQDDDDESEAQFNAVYL